MPENYSQSYFPVLVQMAIAIALAAGLIGASSLLGKRARSPLKDTPYESGMAPVGSARERFSVKFYLVGMIFILFDIEAVFLYPWAVVYRELKMFAFAEMFVFVALVMVGFFYVWKKGALDWATEKAFTTTELAERASDRAAHDAVMDAAEKDQAAGNKA